MLGGMPWSFDDPDTADQLIKFYKYTVWGGEVRVGVGVGRIQWLKVVGWGIVQHSCIKVKESHDRT